MSRFDRIARRVAEITGHASTFIVATVCIIVWAFAGPPLKFSNGWQLTINTSTTIVTFLMVFVIQAAQNRDTKALHAKLDALIAANAGVDDALQRVEERSEAEIERRRP